MVPSSARRPLLRSTLFAFILAVGTVAGAVGRDASGPSAHPDALGRVALGPVAGQVQAAVGGNAWVDPEPDPRYDGQATTLGSAAGTRIAPPTPPIHEAVAITAGGGSKAAAGVAADRHRGRNHVWMPALGINKSVSFYSCSNASYPGNRVYRWGCAGGNNVYLFGHAGSVFKPLHDAYVHDRLRKGMKLFYADASGAVHTYSVAWWKLTTATKGVWAYQRLSSPSLTLQTCIGAASQYRLIVRLTQVD